MDNGQAGMPITFLVADAQLLFAEALARVLALYPGLSPLESYPNSGLQTLKIVSSKKPDVVLLDFWMPDMEGPSVVRQIVGQDPGARVLLLSWFHGPREIEKALDAGAVGFLPKSLSVGKVAEGVKRAFSGESPVFLSELENLSRTIGKRDDRTDFLSDRLASLSSREMEIVVNLGMDLSVKQIAEALFISPATVKNHIHNIITKVGTTSSKEVVAMARTCGLIR